MAIDILRVAKPAGRPKIAADFSNCDDDTDIIERRERFFRICRSLSYIDKLHVANGLAVTLRTVENWHSGSNMPDEYIRNMILKWYDNGKPIKRLLQCDSLTGL